uniref:FimV N-terminal domain-containing protein n=1 Tax=Candidatus Kentrum sp. FW TaxID=2126338 RepID=A0A450SB20_9GAMM|nr:MAG: FimV N-terminal domain-containing protein [Candidatus Kentron sp. FW]
MLSDFDSKRSIVQKHIRNLSVMRKSIFVLVLLLFAPMTSVYALSLTDIDLSSKLNEPLDARIPLRALQPGDMETIRVKLADVEYFTRANLERPSVLDNLLFKAIQNPSGSAYIQITTENAINEPFLSFIVEVSWSRGRILREYTLLLDPPMYTGVASSTVKKAETATARTVTDGATTPKTSESSTTKTLTPSTITVSEKPDSTDISNLYGPVAAKDTLWSVATRFRPNKSVSIEQMMLLIQQYNPDAFSQNNINTLKAGAILRIPNPGKTATIPQAQALAEVKQQHTAWEEFRQKLAGKTTAAPDGSPVPSVETRVDSTEIERSGRVEILSAGSAVEGVGQVGKKDNIEGLRAEISLVKEEIDAKSRENEELRSRLIEAENLIQEFVHLMEIQSDEINALKRKLAETRSEIEVTEPQPTKPEVKIPTTSQVTHDGDDTRIPDEEVEPPVSKTEKAEEMAIEQGAPIASVPISEPTLDATTSTEPKVTASESIPEKAQFMDRIHDNLIIIVAGLGGILVLIGAIVLWLRRQREITEEQESNNVVKTTETFINPQGIGIDTKGTFSSNEPDSSSNQAKTPFQGTLPNQEEKPAEPSVPQQSETDPFLSIKESISSIPEAKPISDTESDMVEKITDKSSPPPAATSDPSNTKTILTSETEPPPLEPPPTKGKATKPTATEGENLNLDFGFDSDSEVSDELPAKENNQAQVPDFPSTDMSDGTIDETQTKLDLAQAYIDMGDTEGARNILSKILKKGTKAHKSIARELLGKLD